MNPQFRREKIFSDYDQGRLTETDALLAILSLMQHVEDDEAVYRLCSDAPGWFRKSLRHFLVEMAENDYFVRWFRMGDTRTPTQVETEAHELQVFLKRMAPALIQHTSNS